MKRYRVVHSTRYDYEGAVSHCLSETRLTPREFAGQRLEDFRIEVHPKPGAIASRVDYFGNRVMSFAVMEPHSKLSVTATSVVTVEGATPPLPPIEWRVARERLSGQPSHAECRAASEYLWESPFIPWLDELKEYARPVLAAHSNLCDASLALMQRIYTDFKYEPKVTSIETPLSQVFADRRGVCQDLAHLMIGALRSHGLAARYVSGYLRGGAEFQGAQASHAWVSVFVPGAGWRDYDPTNNVEPRDGHLTVAWGRDYGDVAPVKGLTVGGGEHKLDVEVHVKAI